MMIKLRNVSKVFHALDRDVKILDDISYDFVEGNIYAIVGASGSGKTTLLNILGLLDFDYQGSCRINGVYANLQNAAQVRNQWISYVYQKPIMFEKLNYQDNINLPHFLDGFLKPLAEINKFLGRLHLIPKQNNKKMGQFSGGEVQRLSLTRGILSERPILLLDETTSALDGCNKEAVKNELLRLKRNHIIIFVTHDMEYAKSLADHIISIADGHLNEKIVGETPTIFKKLEANPKLKWGKAFKIGISMLRSNLKRVATFVSMLSGGLAGLCLALSLCQGFLDYFKIVINQDVDPNVYQITMKNGSNVNTEDLEYFKLQYHAKHGIVCDVLNGVVCENETGKLFLLINTIELGRVSIEYRYQPELGKTYQISQDLYVALGEVHHLSINSTSDPLLLVFSPSMVFTTKGYVIKTGSAELLERMDPTSGQAESLYVYSENPIKVVTGSPYLVNHIYDSFYQPMQGIINGLRKGIILFCGISILISMLGIMTIGLLDMLDRKKQIGLLRLQGWSAGDILKVLGCELGIRGFLTLGIALVVTITGVINMNFIFENLLEGESLHLTINVPTLLLVAGLTLILTIISNLFPLYKLLHADLNSNLHD